MDVKNFAQRVQRMRAFMSAAAEKTLAGDAMHGMPYSISGSSEARDTERLLEGMLVLDEFCSELRAIVEVKQAMYGSLSFQSFSPSNSFYAAHDAINPISGLSSIQEDLSSPKKVLFPTDAAVPVSPQDLP